LTHSNSNNTQRIDLDKKHGFREVGVRLTIGKMTYGPYQGEWRDNVFLFDCFDDVVVLDSAMVLCKSDFEGWFEICARRSMKQLRFAEIPLASLKEKKARRVTFDFRRTVN